MGSSVSLSNASISSFAEEIADARRLYGADSTYVIGLFAGLDLVLEVGDSDRLKRQLRERLIEIESGKATPSAPSTPTETPAETAPTESGLSENSWIKGSVKWFNNDKGYGFISTASDTDVFVHWRDISSWDRSLGQGDEVEFMVTKTAKGFQAINVMKKERGDSPSDASEEVEQQPADKPAASEPTRDSDAAPQASESGDADETSTQDAEVSGADSTDAPTEVPASGEGGSTGPTDNTETPAEGSAGGEENPQGASEVVAPAEVDAGTEASESTGDTGNLE